MKSIKPDAFRRVCMTSLGRQTEQVKVLWLEKRRRIKWISKNHRTAWRGWVGDDYPLFFWKKCRAGHVVKFWSSLFDTNCRIRWWIIGLWRVGAVLEMCWISWPCKWQCWMAVTPMLVRAHICHPEELSSFSRVLGMAVLGPHSPSALESEKTSPPDDRLITKVLPARLGLFCGRDFVTGLGGKSLTLG